MRMTTYGRFYLFCWLVKLVLSQVYFSEDPNYIQANQVAIYGSSFPLHKGVTVGVTFVQAFENLPYVFTGIVQFSLAPTFQLNYRLKCLNYTNNNVYFGVFFAQDTFIYSSSVRFIALMLPPLLIQEYTYKPTICNNHAYSTCIEYFALSFSPSNCFYTYSLKGFNIKNQYVAIKNDNFYSFHIKYGYNSTTWCLILTTGSSTTISTLYIEYIIVDLDTSNSYNVSLSIATVNLTQTKNVAGVVSDLYSTGYTSTATSTFIGLSSFILYPSSILNFDISALAPLNIKLNTINNAQSVIYANIFIVGVGKCLPGFQPIYNTSLNCVKCPLTCLNCWHYLCLTCSNANMFLEIVNDTLSAGNCICNPGFFLTNGSSCTLCDTNCYECRNNPKNCSSCLESFTLVNNRCVNFCIINYSGNGNNNCVICAQGCSTCTASNACVNTTCVGGTYYFEGNCVGTCPSRTYFEVKYNSCMQCVYPCLTCSNHSSCTSCIQNFYLNIHNSLCYACYSKCLTCVGPRKNDCITCIKNFVLDVSTNQCIDTLSQYCGLGQYLLQGNCVACLPGCDICNQQQYCMTCNISYFYYKMDCLTCTRGLTIMIDGKCVQVCGDGISYYQACDDGNLVSGDGCSSNCQIQVNYTCNQYQPSFCWSLSNQDQFTQKKSLINNTILLTLFSETINFDNLHDMKIQCIYYNNTLYQWSYIIFKNSIEITLNFFDHFQNNMCNVTMGDALIKNFRVDQLPQALYYQPQQVNKIIDMTQALKFICFMVLICASLTHFFSNAGLSYNFFMTLNVYVLTLFNYRYLSILVFNFIVELKYVYLLFETPIEEFRKYQYDQNYIFEFTNTGFANNTKLIFMIFGFFLSITVIFRLVYSYILKSVKKMYQSNIRQYKIFMFLTFTSYEPILFFCFVATWINGEYSRGGPLQIIFLVVFLLVQIVNGVFIISRFSARNNIRKFFLNFGLQKVRNYILVLLLKLTDNSYCYSCFLLVLTSLAIIGMKLIDIRNKKRELIELRKKIAVIQNLLNEFFLLFINILVLAVYLSSMGNQSLTFKKKVDQACGWINVALLLLFLISNFILLMITAINKMYRIWIYGKLNKIVPQERTIIHNKDILSEDGEKQKSHQRKTAAKRKLDSTTTNFHRSNKHKQEDQQSNHQAISNYKQDITNAKIIFTLDES